MNRWFDCIQIWYGSLGISDDLINFWDKSIKGLNPLKTKWMPQPIKKRWPSKKLVGKITYEPLVGLH